MMRIGVGIGLVSTLFAAVCGATETKVVVRAKTKDAKFLGTGMGGALVQVRRADTGEVLASGLTSGGTGDKGLLHRSLTSAPGRSRLPPRGCKIRAGLGAM